MKEREMKNLIQDKDKNDPIYWMLVGFGVFCNVTVLVSFIYMIV